MKTALRLTLTLLLCMILCLYLTSNAFAEIVASEEWGNLTWTLDDKGNLIISGNGDMNTNGWLSYRNAIKTVTITTGVTSVDDYAFYDCAGLASVTISDGVTSIGNWAFFKCTGLTSVTIPGSVTSIGFGTFECCYGLTDVYYAGTKDSWDSIGGNESLINQTSATIHFLEVVNSGKCGDVLTWVLFDDGTLVISGEGAMYDYANFGDNVPWKKYENEIRKIILEEGVTRIGTYAFATGPNGYPYLKQVTLPTTLQTIGGSAFAYCSAIEDITLPEGITTISMQCFLGCTKLTTVSLPFSLKTIDISAFHFCSSLSEITIPYGVTTIGWQSFLGCASLESINIPSTVERIESGAFDSSGLTYIYIPGNVSWIGETAFSNCKKLTQFSVDYGNDSFCSSNGVLFSKDMSELYCYPSGRTGRYDIPNEVTCIKHSAFDGASKLTDVLIPESVIDIEPFAFESCTGLEEIILPDNVKNLSNNAFSGCTGLTRAKLSNSLTMIGYETFNNCSSLTDILFPVSIMKVGANAFKNCFSLSDVYYTGTKDQWDVIEYLNGMGATADGNAPLRNANIHYRATFYNVTYDANGGSDAPMSQYKTPGKALTLTSSVPSRYDYYFLGWAESPNAVDPDYPRPGGTFTRDTDTVLYAVWAQPDFVLPDALTEIGYEAFSGGAFRFVELPKKAVSIKARAFADCPNLKYIFIDDEVTEIADDAFGDANNITIFGVDLPYTKSAAELFAEAHGFQFIPVLICVVVNVPDRPPLFG